MDCWWDSALLQRAQYLPPELLEIIRNGSDESYLATVSRTALDPRYTSILFAHCRPLFAHVCASARQHGDVASALALIARVISRAPYLMTYATDLLKDYDLHLTGRKDADGILQELLTLFRFLRHDCRIFSSLIKLSMIKPLLAHPDKAIRYVAIRIAQILLQGADAWFENMISAHIGSDKPNEPLDGMFDDIVIDYRFLTMWEKQRLKEMDEWLKLATPPSPFVPLQRRRLIQEHLFHQSTAFLGGIVLPKLNSSGHSTKLGNMQLVPTPTTMKNVHDFGEALMTFRPLLVSGVAGSGKSSLIEYVASKLNIVDKMVSLHLNEQSDAKLLVGIYSTGSTPGTFQWSPGVLTQAVRDGWWLFVEDLDRAPNEIVSTLLSLIERRELIIPSRKETISAHSEFRIIATVRDHVNHRGEQISPLSGMVGLRHWRNVSISAPSLDEQAAIVKSLYPDVDRLIPQIMAVYGRLLALRQQPAIAGQRELGTLRPASLRDLLKWCRRISKILNSEQGFTNSSLDAIFTEGIDCFTGALPFSSLKTTIAAIISRELNINPQRRDYLLNDREVRYDAKSHSVVCGRYSLPRELSFDKQKNSQTSFSINPHTSRMLERVSAAVVNNEPLLLVGETGVGKTTAVQHLAAQLGKRLVPFNLSQQSESGDLLGGFKPISARSIIMPLHDEFQELFVSSFSNTRNQHFLEVLGKSMARGNWKAVIKLWKQALMMVEEQRRQPASRSSTPSSITGEQASKRRKIETIDYPRWNSFANNLIDVEKRILADITGISGAFAFSFVEGKIVEAVRRGDWVLLDEINLASPDTLESLLSLLDSRKPSILLTERGDVQRIEAAEGFRLFAAMNPATDVGKKDLPAGIRSRFTEIYVESPDRDSKSLQSIVRAYLPQHAASDPALPPDVANLYQHMIALAEGNKLVDGAGVRPHFSLRTLTRMLSFGKILSSRGQCAIRRALYEGFCMSFLTFLDSESTDSVMALVQNSLIGKKSNLHTELKRSLRRPAGDDLEYMQPFPGSKHWVRKGNLPCDEQPEYIITPFVRRNLENLVRASSTQQFAVLLQGPTSSGKTSMVNYLAKRTGHKCVRINNHEFTDLQEYLGTYVSGDDGRLSFQEGALVRALREGSWIILDELNLAPTDVLEALNRLLDDNRELLLPETGETVRPSRGFMLFATQNPAGLYGGRKALSRAFRSRFLELHFDDIPVDELQTILHQRTLLPESRCKRIVQVYRELAILRSEGRLFEQKSFATLRDLFRWAGRTNDTIEQLTQNGFMLLAERVRKQEERTALKDILNRVMSANGPKVQIDEGELYALEAPEIRRHQNSKQSPHVVWTRAMRRLYVLVSRAIANNEPVLLVGETGCGKTTVVQILADALQQDLAIVNAHQNTETGDLVGSQRPVRNRGSREDELRKLLIASPLLQSSTSADLAAMSTNQLLEAFDSALASLPTQNQATFKEHPDIVRLQTLRSHYSALFEWVDGSLVAAMRTGSFFLLDEISLADDSVLERINSVLEPSRTILLAEKGTGEGASVVAANGFQFFATMNPGGDYGKRELSPALRNRFTEIWVPPLQDLEDVSQIVEAKLLPASAPLAKTMVAFAAWFKDRFNTSATASAMSIRDALAWVEFMNASTHFDSVTAFVHGAAMAYVDTLGANPAGLMTLTGQTVDAERAVCLDKLSELLQDDVSTVYHADVQIDFSQQRIQIGPFTLAVRQRASHAGDLRFTFESPTTRSNAMRVTRALQLSKPVLLEGSPGVGKTALISAIANACNVPLTRINLSEQTDLMDLLGSDVPVADGAPGSFAWQDAPFLRALKEGEWVLLDEMNLASQSILEGLNACLDHRGEVFVPEIGLTFQRHPDFRLFAAQNPHHHGSGRKGLPASFVNRFTVVYSDSFQPQDLLLIGERAFPQLDQSVIEKAVSFVQQLDHEVVEGRQFGVNGGPWEFNLRDISRFLQLYGSSEGLLGAGTPRDYTDLLFAQRFRTNADRGFVESLTQAVWRGSLPKADLFWGLSPRSMQLGLGRLIRDATFAFPPSMFPVVLRSASGLNTMQSIMLCVQQGWPVILSGPSGSGKTAAIEIIAAVTGAKTITVAMSSEIDSMDLVGGYEQGSRSRAASAAKSKLRELLFAIAKADSTILTDDRIYLAFDMLAETDYSGSPTAEDLRVMLDLFPSHQRVEVQQMLRLAFETYSEGDKARFEWIDGILVDALQQGYWLVLDNANLCSASVLDRLNSLLEPNGALFISEHPEIDGSPRVIRPHEDFRIFLTSDPKYGELSRAMRNRATELYLLASQDQEVTVTVDPSQTESAIARFEHIAIFAPPKDGTPDLVHHFEIFEEHLTISDLVLVSRFQRQVHLGLFKDALNGSLELPSCSEEDVLAGRHYHNKLKQLYENAVAQSDVPADIASVQTLYPLNNQPLAQHSIEFFSQSARLASTYELKILSLHLRVCISTLMADSAHLARVVRAERQLLGKSHPTRVKQSGSLLLGFLQTMSDMVPGYDETPHHPTTGQLAMLSNVLVTYRSFWNVVLDRLWRQTIEVASFKAVLNVGSELISQAICADTAPLKSWLVSLAALIDGLKLTEEVSWGIACTNLWRSMRPPSPVTLEELDLMLQLEAFSERFDRAAQQFRQPLRELASSRLSYAKATQLARSDIVGSHHLLAKLEKLLPHSEGASNFAPHFRESFDHLYTHFAAHCLNGNDGIQFDVLNELGLFALRPVASSLQCGVQTPHSQIIMHNSSELLTLSLPDTNGVARLNDWVLSILQSLRTCQCVPLDRFCLLQTEASILSQAIASNAQYLTAEYGEVLHDMLKKVLLVLLSTLQQHDSPADLRSMAYLLERKIHRDTEAHVDSLADQDETPTSSWPSTALAYVADYFARPSSTGSTCTTQLGSAWTAFGVACLGYYVPETPFDPALQPQIIQDIYLQSKQSLSEKLLALLTFNERLTGDPTTLRCRLIEQQIDLLGAEPSIDNVCRPHTSEIPQLQADFDVIRREIDSIRRNHDRITIFDSRSLGNLLIVQERLRKKYEAYRDFTGPVTAFLDFIRVGQQLLHQADRGKPTSDCALNGITPLVGATATTYFSDSVFLDAIAKPLSLQERLHWLFALSLRGTVIHLGNASTKLRDVVNFQFNRLYENWHRELGQEQKKHAAKSSLYRYQGQSSSDDGEMEDMNMLFPDFEHDQSLPSEGSTTLVQDLASRIAALHAMLFSAPTCPDGTVLKVLKGLAECWTTSTIASPPQTALPGVIYLLSDLQHNLQVGDRSSTYNIYLDSNIGQIKAVLELVAKAKARFHELHSVWPEHATPVDVLRTCNLISSYSHSDPLMKLMPIIEKLHATITDWQKVASREFSAAGILEELVDLIIGWRRLELSTWAGLFDAEKRRCDDLSSSWWFIAFESVIAASLSVEASGTSLFDHTQDLLSTLSQFLTSCGLGEFSPRLRLLRNFEAQLHCLVIDRPQLEVVRNGLANFVTYYSRYENAVDRALVEGRAVLEKQVKELIQVASWKDRNISILKQSAKGTHKRLTRLVRKYRALLAQPVSGIVAGALTNDSITIGADLAPFEYEKRHDEDSVTQGLSHIAQWVERPQRFVDIQSTVQKMLAISAPTLAATDSAESVQLFLADLSSNVASLREATPTRLNDENKALVSHLKTSKRRLLADVLRHVRLIGFRPNLSQDVRSSQSSLSLVLARVPHILRKKDFTGLEAATTALDQLLSIMDDVRRGQHQHSEDITPAEAVRCSTNIEDILHECISQRSVLVQHLNSARVIYVAASQLETFAKADKPRISQIDTFPVHQLQFLIPLIESTAELVVAQAKLSMKEITDPPVVLHNSANELKTLYAQRPPLAVTETSITDAKCVAWSQRVDVTIERLTDNIEDWKRCHPELSPILDHLKVWTMKPNDTSPSDLSNNHPYYQHEQWVQDLLSCCNLILSATEQVGQFHAREESDGAPSPKLEFERLGSLMHNLKKSKIDESFSRLTENLSRLDRGENNTLPAMAAAARSLLPILAVFNNTLDGLIRKMIEIHAATSLLGLELGKHFISLAQHGFCTPPEKDDTRKQNAEQAEEGTGLGDGEGGDDISKDVGNGEDLSEIAQGVSKQKDGEEIEDEKDAVDMADDELEGKLDEDGVKPDELDGSENADGGEHNEDTMDEETGEVDELGESAIDEKMWDGQQNEEERSKDSDLSKGKKDKQDLSATKEDEHDDHSVGEANTDTDNPAEDEREHVGKEEAEQLDTHIPEQENLELPEDINMEGTRSDAEQESDLDSLEDDTAFADDRDQEMADAGSEVLEGSDAGEFEPEDKNEDTEGDTAETKEEAGEIAPDEDPDNADADVLQASNDDAMPEPDTAAASAEEGHGADEDDAAAGTASRPSAAKQDDSKDDAPDSDATAGGGNDASRKEPRAEENGANDQQTPAASSAMKQLGDALEEWYRQRKDIKSHAAGSQIESFSAQQDLDMTNAQFEHVGNEADADTQAIGTASADQSMPIDDDMAIDIDDRVSDDSVVEPAPAVSPGAADNIGDQSDTQAMIESSTQDIADHMASVRERASREDHASDDVPSPSTEEDVYDVDNKLSKTHISAEGNELMPMDAARQLWAEYAGTTRNLSLALTEQLRLVLHPTQATKMRGDFRTGKRLNIKRIIPYIASSFKRDKIWMRRSVPSKRSYQIMLAIDDSQSMAESESKNLAFETLALVAKSLSMLEVGELCVVGFGETVQVAQDFTTTFGEEMGAQCFQHFSFAQTKTNVRKLLAKSIELFRAARLKASGSASDLWQLQLIISDGVCEDHPSIRQLVRQAQEERIMIVFIIVDAVAPHTTASGVMKQSILDLPTAEFKKDAAGEMQLKMVKYLDTFPFKYYLIVRDVQELPNVLAAALRQWFAEVVDTTG